MPIVLRRPTLAFAALLLATAVGVLAQPTAAKTTRVERGEIGGAVWRAEIPADWNGELILYLHGYHAVGDRPFPSEGRTQTTFRDAFVARGYAYAQSHYAGNGWAVKEALADTEALRRHLLAELGKSGPVKRTWLLGHSMGGFLTALLLERDPDLYAGGVAFCPPLAPATDFFEHGLFDLLAAFDALAGKPQGLPPLADPQSPFVEPEKLGAALQAAPPAVAALSAQFHIRPSDLPLILDFYQLIWKELIARAGGMPIDNRDTLYSGFGDDPAFNRAVRRVQADPAARTYLQQYGTPTGRWADPLLVVHTTYDAVVPPRWPATFADTVERAGTSHLYRLQWVARDGHCQFTADESWQAFSNLLRWVDGGQAPASGELILQ